MREDEAIRARGRASEYTPYGDSNRSTPYDPSVKAVIFDLGGVIVKWSNDTAYAYIAERYGLDFELVKKRLEERIPLVQTGELDENAWMAGMFRSLGMEPPAGYETLWGKTFKESERDVDTLDVIRRLRRDGYKLGMLSNNEPSHAAVDRERGTTAMFDVAVFSYETGMRKFDGLKSPAGGNIYRLTADKLGVSPSECVYVDDNSNCVKGAEASGMHGVLFTEGRHLADDLKSRGVRVD